MKNLCKCLTVFLLAITLGIFGNLNPVNAKAKAKISSKKITLTVGQSKTLKVKNNKKKVKWSSSKKSVATVSKKGKVVAKKSGSATITAKVGKKKYKCKVTVKSKKKTQTTTTQTTPVNTLGTRTNPDNPRNGVTVNNYGRIYYFKLNDVYKGNDAINVLKSCKMWGEYQQEELSEHPNTTLVLFAFDMSAISGYDQYYLDGIDILNPYSFYNSSATQNLGGVESLYLDGQNARSEIKLYNGGSSKMYAAFFIPNGVNSFTYSNSGYWVKYDL